MRDNTSARRVARRRVVARAIVPASVAVLTVAALAGCVPSTSTPTKAPVATSTSTTTQPPAEAVIDLTGTAAQNKAYFDKVNEKLIAAGGDLEGRPFIDSLVAAGYPKTDMEVTPDRTAVNLAADNIQFSIRFGTTCLIGQYGNVGYSSYPTTILGTGRCLVGTTRTIDW